MKIPSRILEAICNDELKSEDFYDAYGKENIEKACREVQNSNEQIKEKYPAELIKNAVAAKLKNAQIQQNSTEKMLKNANFGEKNVKNHQISANFENSQKNRIRKNWGMKSIKIFIPAMAAVVLFAAVLPGFVFQNAKKTGISAENIAKNDNFRVKGAANNQNLNVLRENQESQIFLYRKNNNGVQLLENGETAKNGDVIQITYKPGKNNFGVIFSVDGNGNITRHFPEKSWNSEKLSHEKSEIPLNFSYELDNAPSFECFVMVSSENQFDLSDIEKRLKKAKDVEYLKKMDYLPKKTEGAVFVLEK